MQSVDHSGVFGEVQKFNAEKMADLLAQPSTNRVEVFNGTPENIKKRQKMAGKKYSVKPAYQKAPKINKNHDKSK